MLTSELVYFDGAHFAHIVAYEERKRLDTIRRRNLEAFRSHERRTIRRGR